MRDLALRCTTPYRIGGAEETEVAFPLGGVTGRAGWTSLRPPPGAAPRTLGGGCVTGLRDCLPLRKRRGEVPPLGEGEGGGGVGSSVSLPPLPPARS